MSANLLKNNKGQLHIMQTVFTLIVVFIILFIAFVGFMVFQKGEVEESINKQKQKGSISVASYFLAIPEISCSQKQDVKQNCVDASKMLNFNTEDRLEYYYDYFGNSKITVKILYPKDYKNGLCDQDNFKTKDCDSFMIYNNTIDNFYTKEPFFIPISIYDPFKDSYYAGYAKVEVYY